MLKNTVFKIKQEQHHLQPLNNLEQSISEQQIKLVLSDQGELTLQDPEIFTFDLGAELDLEIGEDSLFYNQCRLLISTLRNPSHPQSLERELLVDSQEDLLLLEDLQPLLKPVPSSQPGQPAYHLKVFAFTFPQSGTFYLQLEYREFTEPGSSFFSKLMLSFSQSLKKTPGGVIRVTRPLRIVISTNEKQQNSIVSIKLVKGKWIEEYVKQEETKQVRQMRLRELLEEGRSGMEQAEIIEEFIEQTVSDHNIGKIIIIKLKNQENGYSIDTENYDVLAFQQNYSKKERGKLVGESLKALDYLGYDFLIIGKKQEFFEEEEQLSVAEILKQNTTNLFKYPMLQAALIFDLSLQQFSRDFIDNKISQCVSAPYIDSEASLQQVMSAIRVEVIQKLSLQEYFLVNIAEHVKMLEAHLKDKNKSNPQNELNKALRELILEQLSFSTSEIDLLLSVMQGHGERRYGVTFDISFAACLLQDASSKKPKNQILKELTWLLTQINNAWTLRIGEFLNEALRNIEDELRYFRLKLRNIKVTEGMPLCQGYFTKFIINSDNQELLQIINTGGQYTSQAMLRNNSIQHQLSTYWLRRHKLIPTIIDFKEPNQIKKKTQES